MKPCISHFPPPNSIPTPNGFPETTLSPIFVKPSIKNTITMYETMVIGMLMLSLAYSCLNASHGSVPIGISAGMSRPGLMPSASSARPSISPTSHETMK